MGQHTREQAAELRAVAPLVIAGASPRIVGTCTLVSNGSTTIAFSSAEILRTARGPLSVALTLDGKRTLPVASWTLGRTPAIGIIELGAAFPEDEDLAVLPLALSSVYATLDSRGAPAALIALERAPGGVSRRIVPVHVDAIDSGEMSDEPLGHVASPTDASDTGAKVDGAPLFVWLPPDPVLGRASEVVVVGLATAYRQGAFKPRDLPPIAELVGLEDLALALPWDEREEGSNELGQVAGEIEEEDSGPLAGLDLDEDD